MAVRVIGSGEEGVISGAWIAGEAQIGFRVRTQPDVEADHTFDELDAVVASSSSQIDPNQVRGQGEGVQFLMPDILTSPPAWSDGYCIGFDGEQCIVYIDGKMIRDHFNSSTIKLDRNQVRTSAETQERLGKKKSRSAKRDPSAVGLATKAEVDEVEGASSEISSLLSRHPVEFGQIMRTGGQTGIDEFQKVARKKRYRVTFPKGTRGRSKNQTVGNAIVAKDTYSLLATRLDDGPAKRGRWIVHGRETDKKTGTPVQWQQPDSGDEQEQDFNIAEFRRKYIFQQGGHLNEQLHLPEGDKRKKLHAEAKVVRSLAWRQVLEETAREFSLGGSLLKKRAPPQRRKVISLAINRSSCGSKKDSGHSGGCAGELAVTIEAFWEDLGKILGSDYVQTLRKEGAIKLEVSVGGEYEKPGKIEPILRAGATLGVHATYDFESDGVEQITKRKFAYMQTLLAARQSAVGGQKAGDLVDDGSDHDHDEDLSHQDHTSQFLGETSDNEGLVSDDEPEMMNPFREQPVRDVGTDVGQASVYGEQHPQDSGQIACTSIAACALQSLLGNPDMEVNSDTLLGFMQQGTDVDRGLRNALIQNEMEGEGDHTEAVADIEQRYFEPEEVMGRFPGLTPVPQADGDEALNEYAGARGDYQRVAIRLTQLGSGHGLMLVIGGATVAVANIGTAGAPTFALFDSHGRALYQTYHTQDGLVGALDALYPALPGASVAENSWSATPYRLTAGHQLPNTIDAGASGADMENL